MLYVKKLAAIIASVSLLFSSPVSGAHTDRISQRESMLSSMLDFIRKSTHTMENIPENSENASGGTESEHVPGTGNTEGDSGNINGDIYGDINKDIYIDVYFHREGKIRTVALDEYITGVVYGEVPESYSAEALKAQAVAARSYAVYRIENNLCHSNGADVCTDSTHCQAWAQPENGVYPDSIAKAVQATHNIVATYDGRCINALYFSNSGGYTESIENVWGGSPKPYLSAVESPGESANYDYCTVKYFTADDFIQTVAAYTESDDFDPDNAAGIITDIKRSESGRIISARAAGKELSGLKIREMLGTFSSNIYFKSLPDGSVITISMGYGHGVGMSQCGAQAMAVKGASYDEILKHYYRGIELIQLSACVKSGD